MKYRSLVDIVRFVMDEISPTNNFILVLGPIGKRSIGLSCWYDLLNDEEKYPNVNVILQSLFDLSAEEQIREIKKYIRKDKINHIIFSLPTSFVNVLPKSLDYIRNLCNCTINCFLLDSFNRLSYENSKSLPPILLNKMSIFDKIYSFSWFDHIAYNFTYHPTPIRYFSENDNDECHPKYDVFFIGRKKGRTKKLKMLADYFDANGVSYLFLVLRNTDDDKDYKNLKYISYIPYSDIINLYVKNSNCILSLCGKKATDPTLAYFESIMYNKKLLTDASVIDSMPFTNKNNQKSFSNISDISIEWIKSRDIDSYSLEHTNFTPLSLFKHVATDYRLFNSRFNYRTDYPLLALHYSNIGWKYQTVGEGIIYPQRLESIALINIKANVSVLQNNYGWLSATGNEICGRTGESLPITAIKISSDTCQLKYRVYILNIGWTSWASDGEVCGITNGSSQSNQTSYIQGVQITLCQTR